jgi:hypothetical protein
VTSSAAPETDNSARRKPWWEWVAIALMLIPFFVITVVGDGDIDFPREGSKWWILIFAIAVLFWAAVAWVVVAYFTQ